jgi:ligand-binding sensor domain-containing protein
MCQDKKGYMWFAADNGESMFDGKKFTNFTTEDGFTDNDVLSIAADSKGRVWVMPFNRTVCYFSTIDGISLYKNSGQIELITKTSDLKERSHKNCL